jgi:hypothetical protein
MCQVRSVALSANSNVDLFPARNAQLSMKLFVMEVAEEEVDLDHLEEEALEGVDLDHLVVAVDLVHLEVMAALDHLEDMVEVLQEGQGVMEQKDGKGGLQTHQEEAQVDMEVDLDLVEHLEEVEEAIVEVLVVLVAVEVDLGEVEVVSDLKEVKTNFSYF